jgi:xanthine dehydrogenase small subunit
LTRFILNDKEVSTEMPVGTTLLDFIRYEQHLMGTKIGCREGDCGACTVLVGKLENDQIKYESATSCLMPLGNVARKHVVTIEGINQADTLTPVQHAFAVNNASQCGFCTPGFIMSFTGYCLNHDISDKEAAIASMDGNICRCTGYQSIKEAVKEVVTEMNDKKKQHNLAYAIDKKIVPYYFNTIPEQLKAMRQEPASTNIPQFYIGGGTDLYVQKHDTMTIADLFFTAQANTAAILDMENEIEVSAGTSVTDFLESPLIQKYFPKIRSFVKLVSSTPIRNMATFAGNFVNASPIGDFTIFFLVLDTSLQLYNQQTNTTRTVLLSNFYKAYKTIDKLPEEQVTHFRFKKPGHEHFFNFEKVCKRTYLDIASVNTAIYLQMENGKVLYVKISAGGVGPIPLLLTQTAKCFEGAPITAQKIDEAVKIMQAEITPISDTRGTASYKRTLLEQLVRTHFQVLNK